MGSGKSHCHSLLQSGGWWFSSLFGHPWILLRDVEIMLYTRNSYNTLVHLTCRLVGIIQGYTLPYPSIDHRHMVYAPYPCRGMGRVGGIKGQFVGKVYYTYKPLLVGMCTVYRTSETECNEALRTLSNHRPDKKGLLAMPDSEFGYYLAGIIDAKGTLSPSHPEGGGKGHILIVCPLQDSSYVYTLKKRLGYGHVCKSSKEYSLLISNSIGVCKVISLINGRLRLPSRVLELSLLAQEYSITPLGLDTSNNLLSTHWLSGYTDALGSFYVYIDRKRQVRLPYRVSNTSECILRGIQGAIGGTIAYNKLSGIYLRTYTYKSAYRVLKYLDTYSLQSSKYLDYIYYRNSYLKVLNSTYP